MATKKFKLTKVNSSGGLDTLHPETEASQVTGLATVATSGSYNDLSNKPTIPTVDTTLSSTSTNPVQNKVINNALTSIIDLTGGL